MVGTAFSGVMVAFFGVPLIVVINGLSNLYSAISELFVRVPRTVHQGETVTVKGIFNDYKTAVKVIFADPALKLFVPFLLILNLLASGPMSLILPFCMEKSFSVDMYGYLMAIWTAASLVAVLILGVVKLSAMARFLVLLISFSLSVVFMSLGYLSDSFVFVCIFAGVGALLNSAGNTVSNASMMLALPEENRGAILGFVQSACVGGVALSTVIYGLICDVFPVYIVFTVGSVISLIPMIYFCFHPKTKEFMLTH